MKIIDCFIFYNELEILKMRLKELDDVVDHFVLVESNVSFSNKKKILFFEKNQSLFKDYQHKIVHIVVDNMPPNRFWRSNSRSAWMRQELQRNSIARGINTLSPSPNDLIILSDVDEVPDSQTLIDLKKTGLTNIANLNQDMYYYNLSCKHKKNWTLPIVSSFQQIQPHIRNLHQLRIERSTMNNKTVIDKGGWHFSYFGGTDAIINKMQNISAHTEIDKNEFTNRENIEQSIRRGVDLLHRENSAGFQKINPEDNGYLPKNYFMLL